MFIFGAIIGFVAAAIIAIAITRRQTRQISGMQRTSSSQFRRITELEKNLAEAKAAGASAVREEKLRNAREFSQYKTLLRRADSALAQAKADRDAAGMEELSNAA